MRPIFRRKALERRFFEWQNQVPLYPGRWATSTSGVVVSQSTAVGLPAVSAAIRLISETCGTLPMIVYQGEAPNVERARDSWQWARLHDQPNDDQSAFDFWQDVAASIEIAGNSYIFKVIASRPVRSEDDIQLFVL